MISMKIDILTLFPEMFKGVLDTSIIKRAQKNGLVDIATHNLRDWAIDRHKTVDDKPYGGGAGMLLKVDVIDRALHDLKIKSQKSNLKNIRKLEIGNWKFQNQKSYIVLLTPQGKTFNQQIAKKLSKKNKLILVCGHYEGFDQRVRKLVDEEISIGNYILTGGEIPAMVVTDAVCRLIPNVLGKNESSQIESFSMDSFMRKSSIIGNWKLEIGNLLEYPQYTHPKSYQPISKKFVRPLGVPQILLSGNHQKIADWRRERVLNKSTRNSTGLTNI